MDGPVKAYVGLGSNQGDCEEILRQTLEQLKSRPRIDSLRASSIIQSPALGLVEQPDYLNAVAEVVTTALPYQLLDMLQEIEDQFGRKRDEKWGPRTLDLDLLVYEDGVLGDPDLTLPHPQMHLRSFVLGGMVELNAELKHPVLKRTMRELHDRLNGGDYWLDENHPQLISTAGLIGVGKSTLAERLANYLDAKFLQEEYDKNPFLAEVYDGQESSALDSELFFLSSSASQLQRKCLRKGDCYVSDYVFDKALIYARQWLNEKELEKYAHIHESVQCQVYDPVVVVYVEDSIEHCLERIRDRKRPYEQGIKPEFLAAQKQAYDQLYACWKTCPVFRVPAAECKEPQQVETLAKEISYYLAGQKHEWKS